MALRDQPYIPLYVQDFMTDEKLSECSAESTGVYIRVMCIMHKSQEYGTVLLKQKDKQNPSKIKNFAVKLHRLMPYSVDVIERSLTELVDEEVLTIEGDMLMQKRMVKDGILSQIRANAGSKGGKAAKGKSVAGSFAQAKEQAKEQANTEYEYEDEIEDEIEVKGTKKGGMGGNKKHQYGEYKNVLLTDDDLEKWQAERPHDWAERIETLSEYIASKGVSYKSHLATMRSWARKDDAKNKPAAPAIREGSYD